MNMELKKYYKFFIRSYFISYFFYLKFNDIIFIKNLKINILLSFNKNYRFIFFIIFSLIFNTEINFNLYNQRYIILKFNSLLIYFVLQYFSLIFLPMNIFNFFLNLKDFKFFSSFSILNFFFTYIVNFFLWQI